MAAEIKIEPYERLKQCAESIGVTSFVNAAHIGPKFVFVTNQFYPLFFNIETRYVSIFRGDARCKPAVNCVDLSDDGQFVITGHDDGSVHL
jgi:hypothetical protein